MAAVPADDILRLSIKERLELVEAIWESIRVHPEELPLSDEVRSELERRLAAHRADPDAAEDLDTVLERLRKRG